MDVKSSNEINLVSDLDLKILAAIKHPKNSIKVQSCYPTENNSSAKIFPNQGGKFPS